MSHPLRLLAQATQWSLGVVISITFPVIRRA